MTYEINDFQIDVVEKSHTIPIAVDFWAEWCGPCKILGPVLERLVQSSNGAWKLAKVNTEKHPGVAVNYRISSIPNVKLFIDGQVANEFVGALPEKKILEWLKKSLPSTYENEFTKATNLLLENKNRQVITILQPIIKAEPENHRAAVLMAHALLYSNPDEAIRTIRSVTLGSPHFERANAIRTLAILFNHMSSEISLHQDAVKEDYLDAIRAVHSGKLEAALSGFIGVVRKNRYYDDDGARKAAISIFHLLGEKHPTTRKYQFELSTALF